MAIQSFSGDLPPAPDRVVGADGRPSFGTYAGALPAVDWRGLQPPFQRSAIWRAWHGKRWLYAGLASSDCYIGMAIVDVGWATTAFAYLFDRASRTVAAEVSGMGLPGLSAVVGTVPGAGAEAVFQAPGRRLHIVRPPGSTVYQVTIRSRRLQVTAELDAAAAPPVLAAVVPVAGGLANCTHKSGALTVRGRAEAAGRIYDLAGATGSLDHTVGLLARRTDWRWASAHGPGLGFNLQAGFNGDAENALWLDGRLIRLGAAEFAFDAADPLAPWQIRTVDGLLDLTFQPEGLRREDKDLGVAVSRYVQPIGTFSGWVRPDRQAAPFKVDRLLGVTEDHQARW